MVSNLNLKAVSILVGVALCLGAAVCETVAAPGASSPGALRLWYQQPVEAWRACHFIGTGWFGGWVSADASSQLWIEHPEKFKSK
jgi:hypothetical protein